MSLELVPSEGACMRPWVSLHAFAFLVARRLRPRTAREPAELCTPHLCVTVLYAIAR